MDFSINTARQVVEAVNTELGDSARSSQHDLLNYLCTQVRVVPKSPESALKFFYILAHLNAIISPDRFIVRSAQSIYQLPSAAVLPRLTNTQTLVANLELPGLENGWRILAALTDSLRLLGVATPTLEGLADIPEIQSVPAFIISQNPTSSSAAKETPMNLHSQTTAAAGFPFLDELTQKRLWQPGLPLRLHLGCGEQKFNDYINVDYPPTEHNVMQVKADIFTDIIAMRLPRNSVDEIRLHHVFEHFSRVTALAMLVKWHSWLKVGGKLHIETPDLMGSARNLVANTNWRVKMGTVRHLTGDQAAGWAYHVEQWFPERFEHTLKTLGFGRVETNSTSWPHEPFLCNVHALATKTEDLSPEQLVSKAESLLWENTVADAERPTFEVWRAQLRDLLAGGSATYAQNTTKTSAPSANSPAALLPNAQQLPLATNPIEEIYDFNQKGRDVWVAAKAGTLPPGSKILDVGAGTCPYRHLFSHCDYKTHDFKQYEGEKLGGTTQYGHIDYVSDIVSIPVPDASFDAIICTEVFEHVPEPIAAYKELARIVKPGGKIWITAPLGSGLHQLPYHFYGGYTPYWYQHFGKQFGLELSEITPNGGFFKHLAQECARAAQTFAGNSQVAGGQTPALLELLSQTLPRLFFKLDDSQFNEAFTVGYFVEAIKPNHSKPEHQDPAMQNYQKKIFDNPLNLETYINAALHLVDRKDFKGALPFVIDALKIAPGHDGLRTLKQQLEQILGK
jgi:predicted SAM-dependent methyltransferase